MPWTHICRGYVLLYLTPAFQASQGYGCCAEKERASDRLRQKTCAGQHKDSPPVRKTSASICLFATWKKKKICPVVIKKRRKKTTRRKQHIPKQMEVSFPPIGGLVVEGSFLFTLYKNQGFKSTNPNHQSRRQGVPENWVGLLSPKIHPR